MADEDDPMDAKELVKKISTISILSGIVLTIASIALGNTEAHTFGSPFGFLLNFNNAGWLPPYAIPAQLGVFMGPVAIIGGCLISFNKGLKIALIGAIGVTTVSAFCVILSIGLFAEPSIFFLMMLIDIALLFCLVGGIYCCDFLLKLKDSRYGL